MPGRPTTFADFSRYLSPDVDEARIAREGVVIICPTNDAFCLPHLEELAARGPVARRTEVELRQRWLWLEGPAEHFVISTVPGAGP